MILKPWKVSYYNFKAERILVRKYKTLRGLKIGIRQTLRQMRPLVDYYKADGPDFNQMVQLQHR